MFTKAALIATMFAISGPAFANETVDLMAKQLGLPPGVYTLAEIVQIQNENASNRKTRIELIDRQKATFQRAVHDAMTSSPPVVSTR